DAVPRPALSVPLKKRRCSRRYVSSHRSASGSGATGASGTASRAQPASKPGTSSRMNARRGRTKDGKNQPDLTQFFKLTDLKRERKLVGRVANSRRVFVYQFRTQALLLSRDGIHGHTSRTPPLPGLSALAPRGDGTSRSGHRGA